MDFDPDIILKDVHPRRRARVVKADQRLLDVARARYPDVSDEGELAYLLSRSMTSRPLCGCGKPASWLKGRYAASCSHTCANRQRDAIGKSLQTIKERYGVDNVARLAGTTERRRATMLAKHGALVSERHISKNPETARRLNELGRQTLLKNHGVINPSQIPGNREKASATRRANLNDPVRIARAEARMFAWASARLPSGVVCEAARAPDRSMGEANARFALKYPCGHVIWLPSETLKFREREGALGHCTECDGSFTRQSIKERSLADAIEEMCGVAGMSVLRGDRKIIAPYELDIVIPERRIAVEFAGLFWHSEERLGADYHLSKTRRALDAGYRLITVFEDEWDQRGDIVLNRLRHILGLSSSVGPSARSCSVTVIDTAIAKAFCDRHHIQGYARATMAYGLHHADRLVAVMTFARPNAAKGRRGVPEGEWELSRFCVDGRVAGAAGRLFAAFVRDRKPTRVVSYSDLRWNTGDLYAKLGFTKSHDSKPNYWYFKGTERFHRFGLRKGPDDNQALTEVENRRLQGWRRIFDCGNSVWIWSSV